MDTKELVAQGLSALGLTGRISPDAPQGLDVYAQALLEQNQVMDLTAITDPREVATLHMLDSAALLACPGVEWEGKSLLDVGSGAGLPGVPLKLLLPSLRVTLLDSLGKRVDWLNEVCAALSLSGIRAVQARAEEAGREGGYREGFDLVTARAVADLRILAELCLPFVRVGGEFLAMKGPDPSEECAKAGPAIARMGGQVKALYRYTIPHTQVAHSAVVVEKVSPTPPGYPRRWSRIKKNPI